MNFTASDVLLKAASRIEEEGMWCQGRFFADCEIDAKDSAWIRRLSSTDRVAECALGALISAAIELGLHYEDYLTAETLLDGSVQGLWISVWNDAPGRTAHEVAEAMRQAALQ